MKAARAVACCPSGVVTTTSAGPAASAGVVQVIAVVVGVPVIVQGFPSKVTVAPEVKLVPVIVTDVPPVPLPVVGETEEIVGDGVGVFTVPATVVAGPAPITFVAVTEIV